MSYIEGFLIPVPTARKADYIACARASQPLFHEYGATRIVEVKGNYYGVNRDTYRLIPVHLAWTT